MVVEKMRRKKRTLKFSSLKKSKKKGNRKALTSYDD